MADNFFFSNPLLIADENSALSSKMSEFLGEAGQKYIKSQQSLNYHLSKTLSLVFEDDQNQTLFKKHWYFERPIMERVYTGNERGRLWNDRQIGVEHIDYPDAFDDVIWEYTQAECDAAEKDVLAYATWYSSKIEYTSDVKISFPPSVGITITDNSKPPSKTISAEKVAEFKKRLLETLRGNSNETVFTNYVNYIINHTRTEARKIGRAKAKTNPVVEEVMKTVNIDEKFPD